MPTIPKMFRRRTPEQRTGTMTLIEHLRELRRRLIIALIAIAAGAILGWFLYGTVIHIIQRPYCHYITGLPKSQKPVQGCRFVYFGPLEPFIIKFKIVIFIGLFIALPVLLYQLWAFIVPGLTDRERRMAIPFIATSVALFALGATVAYLVLPLGLRFLLGFAGPHFTGFIDGNQFVGFVLLLALIFGTSFEFPVLLVFLVMVGVLSSAKLRQWRRGAYLVLAVFAAVVTPSNDPYTMLSLMLPLWLFYEAAIIVSRLQGR
jgi:sec-independent protein translocase protein TatC